MTQQELIKRLETTCFGLDPIDPLRLLVDDVIAALAQPEQDHIPDARKMVTEQEPVALESLLGAIARGWCHEKNANKEMDSDLAMAIATEVKTLYATPPQLEERNFCQRCGKRTKDIHTCTPPQRSESSGKPSAWVGLTDEQITQVIKSMPRGIKGWMSDWDLYEFSKAIEAKLREKNSQHKEKNT